MVGRRRVGEAGADVFKGDVGEVGDDLRFGRAVRERFEDVGDAHPGAGNGRTAAADGGIDGDAREAGERHTATECSASPAHSHEIYLTEGEIGLTHSETDVTARASPLPAYRVSAPHQMRCA